MNGLKSIEVQSHHSSNLILLFKNTESVHLLISISQYSQCHFPDGEGNEPFMFKQLLCFDPRNAY